MQRRKQYDRAKESDALSVGRTESRVRGGYEQWVFFIKYVFLFAQEYAKGKGDIRGKEWICLAIGGRIGGRLRCDLYTPVFTVSQSVERESK